MKKAQRIAVTAGVIWGATMFLTTLLSVYTGYAEAFLRAMGSIYPGYEISLTGSLVGGIYGFLDAFVGVYIIAWVYKKLAK